MERRSYKGIKLGRVEINYELDWRNDTDNIGKLLIDLSDPESCGHGNSYELTDDIVIIGRRSNRSSLTLGNSCDDENAWLEVLGLYWDVAIRRNRTLEKGRGHLAAIPPFDVTSASAKMIAETPVLG